MKIFRSHFVASEPGSLIDYIVVQYVLTFLLIVNTLIALFTIFNLCRLAFRRATSDVEKRETRFRVYVFVLILLAILSREASDGLHMYDLSSNRKPSSFNALLIIIDAVPLILFVNLATTFSYFWFRTYSSYDSSQEELNSRKKSFKISTVLFSILLYTGFIALSAVIATQKSLLASKLLKALLIIGFIWSAGFLIIHGRILYNKTVELLKYSRKTLKSTGMFKTVYILMLGGCVIRSIEEGLGIYFAGKDELSISRDRNFTYANNYLFFFITYEIVFIVVGECLPFFLLVLLLQRSTKKQDKSPQTNEEGLVESSVRA